MIRKIKKIYKAVEAPIADLKTYRALPTHEIDFIDPFLFLNHHGPQEYGPNNRGLPFGPHPHRGFETLTFILTGDVMHKDSGGGKDIITEGGIQWMTAGRGVIHTEVSSEEFKKNGGREEILQFWFNLPSHLKMTQPAYVGLQKDQIPEINTHNGNVSVFPVSGSWNGVAGPVKSITDIEIARLTFKKSGKYEAKISEERNIMFYVVKGNLTINGQKAGMHNLVHFANEGEKISIEALEDTELIFGHGLPFNEPIVAQGPFVMNTQKEIMEAMRDYQMGKMGVWVDE